MRNNSKKFRFFFFSLGTAINCCIFPKYVFEKIPKHNNFINISLYSECIVNWNFRITVFLAFEKTTEKLFWNSKVCCERDFYLIPFSFLDSTFKTLVLENWTVHQISTIFFYILVENNFKKRTTNFVLLQSFENTFFFLKVLSSLIIINIGLT